MNATDKQKKYIRSLLKKQETEVVEEALEKLSKEQACEMIEKLTGKTTEQAGKKPESNGNNGERIRLGLVLKLVTQKYFGQGKALPTDESFIELVTELYELFKKAEKALIGSSGGDR